MSEQIDPTHMPMHCVTVQMYVPAPNAREAGEQIWKALYQSDLSDHIDWAVRFATATQQS